MAEVELRGLCKRFGAFPVVSDIDLTIRDGEFVVFVGPSGCGKSTLLRLIAGLEDASGGDVVIDGVVVNDLPPARRGVAMVFQSYALYPHMTVFENMAFGLKLRRTDRAAIAERVRQAARVLQLDGLLERRPAALSGGQRQRVAIGRAIVRDPKVFLFDEPLSNLDAALRAQMRFELARLRQAIDATMVYVTHDQVEAMTLADRIVVLNAGRVEQVGTPLDLYHRPQSRFVAGFLGAPQMNFIDVRIETASAAGVAVRLAGGSLTLPVRPDGAEPGAAAALGIRPEHVRVDDGNAALTAEVIVVERLGATTHAYLRTVAGDTLVVAAEGDASLAAGQLVGIGLDPADCHLFDAAGRAYAREVSLPATARSRHDALPAAKPGGGHMP